MIADAVAAVLTPSNLLNGALARIADGGLIAPAFALAAGAILSLSPVALPALPAVAAVAAPILGTTPGPPWRRFARGAPRVAAFVVGMDIPLAVAGYLVVEIATTLTRASVVLSGVTAGVLAGVGLRLLLRRGHGCSPAVVVPPGPLRAFAYGAVFSVTGCPGCAPLLIGLGSAAALVGGPFAAAAVLLAFVVGRTAVLLGVSALAGRLLLRPRGARTFDIIVGLALVAAAAYYAYRVLGGDMSTVPPGAPGSNVLP